MKRHDGDESPGAVRMRTEDSSLSPSGRVMHEAPQRAVSVSCRSAEAFDSQSLDVLLKSLSEVLIAEPFKQVLIGLSGGSTPGPIYESLRQVVIERHLAEQSKLRGVAGSETEGGQCLRLDLKRLAFVLLDERYVHPTDEKSNVRLVMEKLFGYRVNPEGKASGQAGRPHEKFFASGDNAWPVGFDFYYPDTSLPVQKCIDDYRQTLSNLLRSHSRLDVAVLGLGEDGHLASVFPPLSRSQIELNLNPLTLALHSTTERFDVRDRISVSLHVLSNAKRKVFLIRGESKLETWSRMEEASASQAISEFPALEVIRSGGCYVVSYPSLDEFQYRRQKQNLQDAGFQPQASLLSCQEAAHLSIVVFGASGDVAKKKTLSGTYDSAEDFSRLHEHLKSFEISARCNRVFYLALPPHVFASCTAGIRRNCWSSNGWNRVVIEKPFGRDSETSLQLSKELRSHLREEEVRDLQSFASKGSLMKGRRGCPFVSVCQMCLQMYRIDHYLGKEMTLSISALRFANVAFKHLFHRRTVRCVRITVKEDFGTQGRGGYFDQYGIIRDVMQNHMLQLLTLIAMEPPASLSDEDVRDEKVKVLKQMPSIKLSETVLGQYTASADGQHPGYLEDPTVPSGSKTPTFCTCALWIENERWKDVPFIFKAGKALEKRLTEIRIQLHPIAQPYYTNQELAENELVILVQPHEAIYLKFYTKRPGLSAGLQQAELDLSVMDRLQVDRLPDAYERLLLDVVKGDRQNFVRSDELKEAWRIFTPLLKEIEESGITPLPYAYGSSGPEAAYEFIQEFYSYRKEARYHWKAKH